MQLISSQILPPRTLGCDVPQKRPMWGVTLLVTAISLTAGVSAIAAETKPAKQLIAAEPENSASKNWPVPRGDAQSTGSAPQSLPTKLQILWEFKAAEAIETTPVVADGRVFVGDVFGQLYAVGLDDGAELWRKNYDTGFMASPAVRDGLVVIGDIDGKLYAIDAKTGEQKWVQEAKGEISGAAAFYESNVLVTSQDGSLSCFQVADGTPVWTYQTDDQIRCNPTLAGHYTFLGGCDGSLHVVDIKTGKADGEPLPLGGPTGSTPVVSGSKVILPIMDGVILAFDWKQKKQLWGHEDPEQAQEYRGSGAVSGDLFVVSSRNKHIDAISIADGTRRWRYTVRRRSDASPVIAGEDVWIASTDGRLTRLALADGKEKWSYEIRGSFLAAPAIAGDRMIIADDDGVVRCFGVK